VSVFVPGSALVAEPLLLTHVHVIDGTGAPILSDQTVRIEDRRIVAIERAGTVAPGEGRVLDGNGGYLIPGLWDMHVHWFDEAYLDLFVANGVTGVRQMFGAPVHLAWRGGHVGSSFVPRQSIAGPIVDGPDPIWPGSMRVGTADEGREAVRTVREQGYDFVKVYNRLPREAYFAIADESKRLGFPFAGHVPRSVTAEEASDAGQKSIEHLDGVLLACSPEGAELAAQRASAGPARGGTIDAAVHDAWAHIDERMLDTYDEARASALFSRFARNGTWHCPTLTILRAAAMLDDADFRDDPRLRYMPPAIRESWQPGNDPYFDTTERGFSVAKRVFRRQMEVVHAMQRAGARILTGTDVLNPYCFPGFSVHDELDLLVEAGLTPLEALQAATVNAATFNGLRDSLGTIEVGKIADLVLLEANPLEDIHNTQKIAAVVVGGRLLERPELDAMLARVEKVANRKSIAEAFHEQLNREGLAAAVDGYWNLKANDEDAYDFGEGELNDLGYQLLREARNDEAVAVFQLNVEAFPQSGSAHDSLAEAYLVRADSARAIAHYRKSAELDPENRNAIEMLEKLAGEKQGWGEGSGTGGRPDSPVRCAGSMRSTRRRWRARAAAPRERPHRGSA